MLRFLILRKEKKNKTATVWWPMPKKSYDYGYNGGGGPQFKNFDGLIMVVGVNL